MLVKSHSTLLIRQPYQHQYKLQQQQYTFKHYNLGIYLLLVVLMSFIASYTKLTVSSVYVSAAVSSSSSSSSTPLFARCIFKRQISNGLDGNRNGNGKTLAFLLSSKPKQLQQQQHRRTMSSSSSSLAFSNTIPTFARQSKKSISNTKFRFRPQSDEDFENLLSKLYAGASTDESNNDNTVVATIKEEINPGQVDGTNLQIVQYPHPALRTINELITIDELQNNTYINQLVKEMFLIMYASNGVGLAAPQVGINKRLMIYNPSGDKTKWLEEVILLNPTIIDTSTTTDIMEEGCLSFPKMTGNVQRYKWIKVEAMSLKGKIIKKKFSGYEARIFQHEYDHLDGIVYIDRLTDDSKNDSVVQQRIQELITTYGPGGII